MRMAQRLSDLCCGGASGMAPADPLDSPSLYRATPEILRGWEGLEDISGPAISYGLLEPLIAFELALKKSLRAAEERRANAAATGGLVFFPGRSNSAPASSSTSLLDPQVPLLHLTLSRLARNAQQPMVAWGVLQDLDAHLRSVLARMGPDGLPLPATTPASAGGGVRREASLGTLGTPSHPFASLLAVGQGAHVQGGPRTPAAITIEHWHHEASLEQAQVLQALKKDALAAELVSGVIQRLEAVHEQTEGVSEEGFSLLYVSSSPGTFLLPSLFSLPAVYTLTLLKSIMPLLYTHVNAYM